MFERSIGALLLAIGGLLSIAVGSEIAARPYGDTALVRILRSDAPSTYRSLDDLDGLSGLAVACIIAGALLLLGRQAWRAGRAGRIGVGLFAVASASLLVASVIGPFPLRPIGLLCLAAGHLGLGLAALRSRLLPRAAALPFTAAGPLLLLFNSEDDRALMLVVVGLIWSWVALEGSRALFGASVVGAAAALAGGLLFLLATQVASASAAFPISALLFGVAAAAAYRAYAGPRARLRRIGVPFSLAAGTMAMTGHVIAGILPWEHPLAYAGWFLFVVGVVSVSAGLLVLGVVTRTAILIAIPLLPVIYLAAGLALKLAVGWWISDPGLQALGEIGAALTIGAGWVILGVAMIGDFARERSQAPSGDRAAS